MICKFKVSKQDQHLLFFSAVKLEILGLQLYSLFHYVNELAAGSQLPSNGGPHNYTGPGASALYVH